MSVIRTSITPESHPKLWARGTRFIEIDSDAVIAGRQAVQAPAVRDLSCIHRGANVARVECPTCAGRVEVKVFNCSVHGKCSVDKPVGHKVCAVCPDRTPGPSIPERQEAARQHLLRAAQRVEETPVVPHLWACGVTTVPERRSNGLLLRTLASLRAAGFDAPRLFVDGALSDDKEWSDHFQLHVTLRWPRIGAWSNWLLGLLELYLRNPAAERFAMFQDDLTATRNLRQYLDTFEMPERGYWNLFTFLDNEPAPGDPVGWQDARSRADRVNSPELQGGRGALGLVFGREAVVDLLAHRGTIQKRQHQQTGNSKIDGCVVSIMNACGRREVVHNPSLLGHEGIVSTLAVVDGAPKKWVNHSSTYPGENFDALSLLK